MSSSLLTTRRFAPLFWTQFFSAFSDNFLKNSLVFLILFHPAIQKSDAEALITLAAAVFISPYFFLSALGGQLADRYDKALIAQRLKFAEIGVALIAVAGFWLHHSGHDKASILILFVALFLFGVIASLFGPIKYGILPDHLARSELPAGNALVEGATFIAILLGTIVGGIAAKDGGDPFKFAVLMIVFSLMCWGASLFIPRTGQAAPDLVVQRNILASTAGLLKYLREDRRLLWGAIVTSWFWLVGAVALSLMPPLVKNVLGGDEEVVTTCLAVFSISIAIGSGLAAWLAAGRIILLPTVIGAFLLGVFALDLGWSTMGVAPIPNLSGFFALFGAWRGIRLAIDLSGLAIAGGLFIVPVFAAVQAWAGADRRARVVAAVNVLNAAFMTGSALIVALLQAAGMTTSDLFLLLGVCSLLVAIAIGRTMPASALSDALSIIYRALFRIEVKGIDNLTKAGPNVIIALNHVSFLDAGLALSLRDRKPVFAIDVGIAKHWWVRPFVKLTNAMPLDPMKPMAVRTLIDAVKAGNALIIFPEGRITVTGSLMKVYDGAAMIADKSDAEIVPVRIEGLEQTPFSRLSKGQVRRKWFPKVKVTMLEPVKLTVDPDLKGRKRRLAAGAALYGIMSDLVFRTTSTDRTVFQAVVEAAHVHGRKTVAVEDPVTGALSYKRLLAGAAILGAKLMPLAPEGRARRRDAAERQRRGGHHSRPDVGGARAGDDQLHRRRGQYPGRLQGRAAHHHRDLAHLRREGQAHQPGGDARADDQDRLSRGHPRRPSPSPTRSAACSTPRSRWSSASPTTGRRSCSPRAPRACPRASCCPTATCWRTPPRPPRASISDARTRCSTCCRCSIRSGSRSAWCCRWSPACASISIRRRCITAPWRS